MNPIRLPWPNSKLRPNARIHHMQRARLVKVARQAAHLCTLEAKAGKLNWDGAHLNITFFPPDNRRRDLDGMLSASKAYLDGISDATGIDDSKFTLQISRGSVTKGGEVVVVLSPINSVTAGDPAADAGDWGNSARPALMEA